MKTFKFKSSKIQYETWGQPGGRAIFFLHGFPGSHHQAAVLVPFVEKQNLFLVACDRPGYGETSVVPTPTDFLLGAHELMRSLGADRYEVMGVSGGAPWAHVMASMFSNSIRSLGLVCGLASFNRETARYFSFVHGRGLRLRGRVPVGVVEFLFDSLLRIANPHKSIDLFLKLADLADKKWLAETMNRRVMATSLKHAFNQRAKGLVSDSGLYHQDWLRSLCSAENLAKVPTAYFHGTADPVLNHRMSEWMHAHNPGSRLILFPGETHYSLPIDHSETILREMAVQT